MDGRQRIKLGILMGVFSLVLGFVWNLRPEKAEAACGASTSSCTTCHEVKAEAPVLKKGDWHVQHAFGDFCQACHLGEATVDDKGEAHEGIINNPLVQPSETCASCHPADTAARVVKYNGSPGGTGTLSGEKESSQFDVSSEVQKIQQSDNLEPNLFLAWVLGVMNGILLLVLLVLIWRWKKGAWPWASFKKNSEEGKDHVL